MSREIGEAELPEHMRTFVALWRAKAGDRPWPSRREYLFDELVPWLGRMHLVDVLDGDFRFAVFGTSTMGHLRREYTGMRLSEIADPLARNWEKAYADALARRTPVLSHHPLAIYGDAKEQVAWWRAILPMGTDGRVEHLLVLIQMYRPDGSFL